MHDLMKKVFSSEIKGIDEKECTLTAYISTGQTDRMNESLDPKGVNLKDYNRNPVVLWAHDYASLPIGKALWTKKDAHGIIAKVKFASTQFAQEVFQMYKGGFLSAFSVGFIPKEVEDGDGEKQPRRTFRKWDMLEFSAVPVPANPGALALAMQKGIVTDGALLDSLTKHDDDQPVEEPAAEEEAPAEEAPVEEEAPAEEKPEEESGLEDLVAENDQLKEQIDSLKEELGDLRYKLYEAVAKGKQEQTIPGIAVDDIASKVVDIIDGAIRKHQGKLD